MIDDDDDIVDDYDEDDKVLNYNLLVIIYLYLKEI